MADNDQNKDGVTIAGVEVFRTGIWNGDKYTAADLDDMVSAFDEVGYQPPVKLGHETKDNEPAYGWVTNLRKVGETLIADFINVPSELAEMIRAKRFGAVSSEIFFNLSRNGKKFRRALKAVSILGSEIPGVAGLTPLFEAKFGELNFSKLACATEYEQPKTEKVVKMETVTEVREAFNAAIEAGDADKIKELSDKLAEIAAGEAKEAALKEQTPADDGKATLEIHALKAEMAELRKNAETAAEDTRQRLLDAKVQSIVPSLRPYIRAFYDLSTNETGKTVKFSIGEGEEAKDISAEATVDAFVNQLSKVGSTLKSVMAVSGEPSDIKTHTGADVEMDAAIKALREKDGKLTYQQAFAKVRENDPQLAARYAQETN